MKHYYIYVLLFLVSGCALTKQERVDNRVAKKIEKIKAKYPASFEKASTTTLRIDTVIKEVRIQGQSTLDTVEVEVFLTEYLHDTISKTYFIDRFIAVARDTVERDTLGLHLWISGVGVVYTLKKDAARITAEKKVDTLTVTKTEVTRWIPWWIWIVLILAVIAYGAYKILLKRM